MLIDAQGRVLVTADGLVAIDGCDGGCCLSDEPPGDQDWLITNCATGPCAGNDALPAAELSLVIPAGSVCSPDGVAPGVAIATGRVLEYGGLCWFVQGPVGSFGAFAKTLPKLQATSYRCVGTGPDALGCDQPICTRTKYIRMRPCPAFTARYGPTDRAIYTCAVAIMREIARGRCPIGLERIDRVYPVPPTGPCVPDSVCLTPDTTDVILDDELGPDALYTSPVDLGIDPVNGSGLRNCCDCSGVFLVAAGCDNPCQFITAQIVGQDLLAQDQACCGRCDTLSGSGSYRFESRFDGLDPRPGTGDVVRRDTLATASWIVNANGTISGTRSGRVVERRANGQVVTLIEFTDQPFTLGSGFTCPTLVAGVYGFRWQQGNVNTGVNIEVGGGTPITEAIFRGCQLYSERLGFDETLGDARVRANWQMAVRINYAPGDCGPVDCTPEVREPPGPVIPPDADPLDVLGAMGML